MSALRHDWTTEEVSTLFEQPFNDLLFQAQTIHREHFDPNEVQVSTLLNIKTGACPEDCKYCSQSARYDTGLERETLMSKDEVLEKARAAKAAGATRFCMGAAWRNPKDKDLDKVTDIVSAVSDLGLETCATLGMLSDEQASKLKCAGLDYYNHNLDTSERYYKEVITTRSYQDRLDTLESVRKADIKTCCGGIIGMGEEREDRIALLQTLANLPAHPDSVPINMLVRVPGTPLHALKGATGVEPTEFVRTIAVARIVMPQSMVRLSAGRTEMSEEMQALCFFAGANSIFYGDKLLTTENPETHDDLALFAKLGIRPMEVAEAPATCGTSSASSTTTSTATEAA